MEIYDRKILNLWTSNSSFRLCLQGTRICSDPFGIGSTLVQIHSDYTGPVLNWNGTVPHRITFINGPIWYQVADPIRTGSTRSRVNTRLIRTNFVPVPNESGPCKRCVKATRYYDWPPFSREYESANWNVQK